MIVYACGSGRWMRVSRADCIPDTQGLAVGLQKCFVAVTRHLSSQLSLSRESFVLHHTGTLMYRSKILASQAFLPTIGMLLSGAHGLQDHRWDGGQPSGLHRQRWGALTQLTQHYHLTFVDGTPQMFRFKLSAQPGGRTVSLASQSLTM